MTIYHSYSDQQLLLLLRKEDEAAFAEIYNRYWDKLFVQAMHRLNHTEEAKEIVQDIFLNLWKKKATLDIQYTLHTYLATAVKYELINLLATKNRQQRHLMHATQDWEEGVFNTENQVFFSLLQEQLNALVNTLPEKCRIIFRLSRDKGYSHKKIAAEMGIAEKTVEAHLANAIRKLKVGLGYFLTLLFVFTTFIR